MPKNLFVSRLKITIIKFLGVIYPSLLITSKFNPPDYPEFDSDEKILIKKLKKNNMTMCSTANLSFTLFATKLIINNNIPGDFVEVGIWRGAHLILAKKIFSNSSRNIIGFDSFSGMTKPNLGEVNIRTEKSAVERFNELEAGKGWSSPTVKEVNENLKKYCQNSEKCTLIKGDIRNTLNENTNLPRTSISVLRIDVDWYELTMLSLEILYPLVSKRGIIIIDDYGSWSGAKEATDQFRLKHNIQSFLMPIDDSARYWVKI